MVLLYVPAGDFLMGSTETDPGADHDEFPQHKVYLDAFWIDHTVVTNAMYARFLDVMGNQVEGRATWLDAAAERVLLFEVDGKWQPKIGFENFPAVEITWFGAQAYCKWVGRRLPTEAEWEKAARSGDGRTYPWGEEIDCEKALVADCGGGLSSADSKPAGASPYGVLGLSGNVWEWVSDWYADEYYLGSPNWNPTGPDGGVSRVIRGGAWEYDWKHARAANRRNNGPAVSMPDYGFRCVLDDGP
jgi:formylglycine-generating enzyme required for sulfatase activity